MPEPESRVYACRLSSDRTRSQYLRIHATEGVVAPGRGVQVRIDETWRKATVVTPWADGSVVCLELGRE